MEMLGRLIGGRYRLIAPLGEGGMATLWRAVDEQLDREVAVKLLRPQFGADPGFTARFKQEARSAGQLSHPNIVSVYDYGTDPVDAAQFIVMQLVDGEDLAAILRDRGRLSINDAVRVAAEVASALEAAHRRGIVHRDVKPGNILITDGDRTVKVTDFGIARAVSEASMTVTGTTLGSVHYFSPEQARGDNVTGASDVYSLGIVLYEMLTGRRPFEGDSAAGVALRRLNEDPQPPSALGVTLPPGLEAILMRALAREREDRYPDAGAFAEALRTWQRDPDGIPSPGLRPAAAVTAAATPRAGEPTVYVPPRVSRPADRVPVAPRRPVERDREGTPWWIWLLLVLGIALLAAIGFLGAQIFSGLSPGASPSPSASVLQVPNWVGDPISQVLAEAADLGLKVDRRNENSDTVTENDVIRTDPPAGQRVDKGSTVTVFVSSGKEQVAVPPLRGQTRDEAGRNLADRGLSLGTVDQQYDATVPSGSVISSNPPAGQQVAKGSSVDIVLSLGPTPSPSPSPTPVPTPTPTPMPTPTPTLAAP
jgi:eukaryotic-like serine/threonine-protein kinase